MPFKITHLLPSAAFDCPQLILMSPLPGVFGGDELEIKIHLETGAKILITTQSAPKIHPSQNRLARLKASIKLEKDSSLIWSGEATIPFKDSRFDQQWRIDAHQQSSFIFWDSFCAGRILSNERWLFKQYSSSLAIKVKDELILQERFSLVPEEKKFQSPFILADYNYLGFLCAYQATFGTNILLKLRQLIGDQKMPIGFDLPAENLLTGRILAKDGVEFKKIRHKILSFTQSRLYSKSEQA